MEAMRTAAPELDGIGDDAIAGPAGGTRHRSTGELAAEPAPAREQPGMARHGCALGRHGGGEPAATLAGVPVGIGFGRGDRLDATLDTHLLADGIPIEG